MKILSLSKHFLRNFYLYLDSKYFGRELLIRMPNQKHFRMRRSARDNPASQSIFDKELEGYWKEHRPISGEIHLDVGAQVGSYTLLAASEGSKVYSFEPDSNNRRLLKRNLKTNHLSSVIIETGVWNKPDILGWRSQSAMSSIRGIGELSVNLTASDTIKVDTIDQIVKSLGISRIDVIKMDIEGAEIEAVEGATETILTFRPTLLIEAYHLRDEHPTKNRVINCLKSLGVPDSCIKVTDEMLLVVKGY